MQIIKIFIFHGTRGDIFGVVSFALMIDRTNVHSH